MTTPAAARLYLSEHLMACQGKPVAVFNPHSKPISELPAIYAFSNVVGGGDGIAYAIAEDGTALGSHWCSNEGYVPYDLGVIEDSRDDRHEEYRKHYPDGYRMEFIPAANVKAHAGLTKAYELNQKAGPVTKEPE